jgi:HEAT repeat protein
MDRERLSLLVKDENATVRRTAVNALASLKSGAGIASLIMALVDEDADVRIAAAEALGESGGEEVLPPLLLALKDEDPWVKCAALRGLGRLGHGGAREAVMEVLDGSTDGLLTITAMESLAKICGEGAVERVKRALSSSDEEVVKSAMEILSTYGNAWIDDCREMLLNHPHWDVRRNFIRLMVANEGEKSLPHLRSAIDVEGDVLVREQILEILDRYR